MITSTDQAREEASKNVATQTAQAIPEGTPTSTDEAIAKASATLQNNPVNVENPNFGKQPTSTDEAREFARK